MLEAITCALLVGPKLKADAHKVHQLLKNILVAESVEQWICDNVSHANGWLDMQAFRDHSSGEKNAS